MNRFFEVVGEITLAIFGALLALGRRLAPHARRSGLRFARHAERGFLKLCFGTGKSTGFTILVVTLLLLSCFPSIMWPILRPLVAVAAIMLGAWLLILYLQKSASGGGKKRK